MKISRERKIYVALVGVGLLALAADRVLFAEADPAAGDALEDAVAAPEELPVSAILDLAGFPDLDGGQLAPTLAERLGRLGGENRHTDDLRNVFAVPDAWRTEVPSPAAVADEAGGVDDFSVTHRLMAVVPNARTPCIVVEGVAVLVGQIIDGYQLVEVRQRSAAFVKGKQRVELHLDDISLLASTQVQ